jgi:multidrug efflux pump subunit AcrA (membrane-fusion protein)
MPFPASIHGYIETSIYAKTPGYLKAIYVDKGDRVHSGDVLALLRSPELDKQVADAKANYWFQNVTDRRNQDLVSEQVVPNRQPTIHTRRCYRLKPLTKSS